MGNVVGQNLTASATNEYYCSVLGSQTTNDPSCFLASPKISSLTTHRPLFQNKNYRTVLQCTLKQTTLANQALKLPTKRQLWFIQAFWP